MDRNRSNLPGPTPLRVLLTAITAVISLAVVSEYLIQEGKLSPIRPIAKIERALLLHYFPIRTWVLDNLYWMVPAIILAIVALVHPAVVQRHQGVDHRGPPRSRAGEFRQGAV